MSINQLTVLLLPYFSASLLPYFSASLPDYLTVSASFEQNRQAS